MGVEARITLFAPNEDAAREAAAAAFGRMAELEAVMSDYRADSELMLVCARAGSGPVDVSTDLARVLGIAEEITSATDGAFDVSIGPVVRVWRAARRAGRLPDEAALSEARARSGWHFVALDEPGRRLELRRAGMLLDLGGIGKGFAVDEACSLLSARGVERYLVDLGGDLAAGGAPPGRRGWTVALASAGTADVLPLSHGAVAMSGDTEQHLEVDGVRYSHIVDPRSGRALTSRVLVTVVAPGAATADALASALSVLGPERGLEALARFPGAAARIEQHADGRIVTTESAGFPALQRVP